MRRNFLCRRLGGVQMEVRRIWALLLVAAGLVPVPGAGAQVEVRVDLAKPLGPYRPIYSWFGYDESNYTTARYGRQLLTELHDLSPAPVYIRAHHLLTSGDGIPDLKWSSSNVFVLDPAGKPVYDFTITDQTFDAYRDARVRPMVELGFMPRDLAATVPGIREYRLRYPAPTMGGASNNPPRDYRMWGELVRRYVTHLVERYGREEVSRWYFEVWNEPDILYWHGTEEDYLRLYDFAAAGVRQALPGAMVGGPATTGPGSARAAAYLDGFLEHCRSGRSAVDGGPVPLSFISFHVKGRPSVLDGHVRMGLAEELRSAQRGFEIVRRHPGFEHLPIILSEADPEGCAACSMKENPANAYRNGPLYAAYTAAAMKGLIELGDRSGVNLISMLSWSFEFEGREYFEGFRTLATNGIDKPVLNLFRMAGLMSGERVAAESTGRVPLDEVIDRGVRSGPDVDALATRGDHEAAVLVWNYHDDDLPAEAARVSISVGGIPASATRVLVEHDRIDGSHSNAYAAWQSMGSPQQPTKEQYERLKAAGQLEPLCSPQWIDLRGGRVTIETSLPRQALSLVRLRW